MWLISSGALRDKSNNPDYYKLLLKDWPNYPGNNDNQIEIVTHIMMSRI